jgi:hypothetical protein
MSKRFAIAVVALAALGVLAQIHAHYRYHSNAALPDPKVTPGAVQAGCTTAQICDAEFRAGLAKYASAHKREACETYGVKKCDASVEEDHLISLNLCGCVDCANNIWPQPVEVPGARQKAILAHRLNELVCNNEMKLADAQKCIADDWAACYVKHLGWLENLE